MESIWTKINDNIPQYMDNICKKYKMKTVKISRLKTAIIGRDFALVLFIDRFDVDISYLYRENEKLVALLCDNYFAEKYDKQDRINLLTGTGAEILVINDLIIIANGMLNKWYYVLEGKKEWIDDFKKSKWFAYGSISKDEYRILEKYI